MNYGLVENQCGEIRKLSNLIGKEVQTANFQIHSNLNDITLYSKILEERYQGIRYGRDILFLIAGIIVGCGILSMYRKIIQGLHIKL